MRAAYDFGADAVYAGQPRYSLRARNNEFSTYEALKEGIDEAHRRGKQFYVASNIYAHNSKLKTYLDEASRAKNEAAELRRKLQNAQNQNNRR